MSENIASQPLRHGRVWMDFGKLVLAAVVQGVVVSLVVAAVVVILAAGSAGDAPVAPDTAVSRTPAAPTTVSREQG